MAQLKNTIVSGILRATEALITDILQIKTVKAPSTSGGSEYSAGTNGQVLKSNGTSTYWGTDDNTTYTNGNGISLSGTTISAAFPTSGTPSALGTASNGSSNNVARADHVHAKPAYGNITTDGAITSDTAVASGDKLIVSDSSVNSKLIRSGISFDGTTTTKALTPNGTWESVTYYVKGTQTAATGAWTGELPNVDALFEGLTIDYWLPFAGSGDASLTLTLKGGTDTDAIPVYYAGTTRCTTHLAAQCIGRFTYQTVTISDVEYTGWWLLRAYYKNDNTTDIVNLYQGTGSFIANSAVYRYQLLFQMDEDKLTPLNNVSNNTGTSKAMLTNVEFDPFGYVFYYNSTTTVDANSAVGGNLCYYTRQGIDLRYTFNCAKTLTANKMVYLKLTITNEKAKIASASPWAQELPDSNDGYFYMLLGRTSSTYQMSLYRDHPIYYHDGTALRTKIKGLNISYASETLTITM